VNKIFTFFANPFPGKSGVHGKEFFISEISSIHHLQGTLFQGLKNISLVYLKGGYFLCKKLLSVDT